MKTAIFLIFLLCAVSALALSTDKVDYVSGESVAISVDCVGASILQIKNAQSTLIYNAHGLDTWQSSYNTASDSSVGKYQIDVSCAGSVQSVNFCVDSPGCTVVEPATPDTGGGGRRCNPEWSCNTWSFCNASLKQDRRCVDVVDCLYKQPPKTEIQSCPECQENWICNNWGPCTNGQQSRTCNEEHRCGSFLQRPAETRTCGGEVAPPAYVPPAYVPPPVINDPEPSFLSKYLWYLVAAAIVLIAVVILTSWLVVRNKPEESGPLDEAVKWIKEERISGVQDDKLKVALKGQGWHDEDIKKVFEMSNKN